MHPQTIVKMKTALSTIYDKRLDSILNNFKFLTGSSDGFDHYLLYIEFEFKSFNEFMRLKIFEMLLENNINPFQNNIVGKPLQSTFNFWLDEFELKELISSFIKKFIEQVIDFHERMSEHHLKLLTLLLEKIRNQL